MAPRRWVGAAVAVAGVVFLGAPDDVGAQDPGADHDCGLDLPENMAVIEHASSGGEDTVLCNFSIAVVEGGTPASAATIPPDFTLFPPEGSVDVTFPSNFDASNAGMAITIEYFCTSLAADERWDSINPTGRDTLVFSDPERRKVIIEEGPMAGTEIGREREFISSMFFPNVDFGLEEKAWIMLNEQTLATIVIITNTRDVSIDSLGEGLARTVSANHTPESEPGCDIRPVAKATPGAGGKKGGGDTPWVIVAIGTGGAATVAVGGWKWTRKKPRSTPPSDVAAGAPPQCAGIAERVDQLADELEALNEAHEELVETLNRAKKIHQNNIVKAKIVINIEIITAVAGPATDLAVALRGRFIRNATTNPLAIDTWQPPSNASRRLRDLFERAKSAIDDAARALGALAQQADQIRAQLSAARRTAIDHAQQVVEIFEKRLANFKDKLPLVDLAAREMKAAKAYFDEAYDALGRQAQIELSALSGAKTRLSSAEAALEHATSTGMRKVKEAEDVAFRLREELRDLQAAVSDAPTDALRELAERRVAQQRDKIRVAQQEAERLAEQLEASTKDFAERVARGRTEVAEAAEKHAAAAKKQADCLQRVNNATKQMAEFSEFDWEDPMRTINGVEQDLAAARKNAETAGQHVDPELQAQLAAIEAKKRLAEQDLIRGHELMSAVRRNGQAMFDPADSITNTSLGGRVASAAWYPFGTALGVAAEVVLGVGQSPQEIWDILVAGQQNIEVFEHREQALRKAIRTRQRKLAGSRKRLEECVKGVDAAQQARAAA